MSLRSETFFRQVAAPIEWTSHQLKKVALVSLAVSNKLYDLSKSVRAHR